MEPSQAPLAFIVRFQPAQAVPDHFLGGTVLAALDLAGDEALMVRCEHDSHTGLELPLGRLIVNSVWRFSPGFSCGHPRVRPFRAWFHWLPCAPSYRRRPPKSSPELLSLAAIFPLSPKRERNPIAARAQFIRFSLRRPTPLLNLNGMLGNNFVVQYNSNLAESNWLNLIALTNSSASPYLFLDPAGESAPARFYRAFMR